MPLSTLDTPLFPSRSMDFHELDNVKAEKAEAMRRFRRSRNFRFILFIALLFSASFLSPRISSAAADLFRRLFFLFHQPSFVFLLLNAIITVIFISSDRKSDQVELLDPYVKSVDAVVTNAKEAPATYSTYAGETFEESKRLVISDEVATVTNASLAAVSTVSEAKEATSLITALQSENQEAELEIVIGEAPENHSQPASRPPPAESGIVMVEQTENPMDELSSDEFRLRIETFIEANKRTLYREKMAEWEANGTIVYRGDVCRNWKRQ